MRRWRTTIWLSLMILPLSCAWTTADDSLVFSSYELREAHPDILSVVTNWEENKRRRTLPIGKGDVREGFVLEYTNSGFIDYRSIIAAEAENGIRAFMNNEAISPSSEQRRILRAIFERIGRYKGAVASGKNINPVVSDGNVYLLTLIDRSKVVKIPFYAPNLDDENPSEDISLLKDILDFDAAVRRKAKK